MSLRAWLRRIVRGRQFVRVSAATRLVVIGDSHCKFWSGDDAIFGPDRIPGVVTCHVGPALAWNLIERSSNTRAGVKVEGILRDLAAQSYDGWALLSFGEIDIRVHAVKHAANSGLDLALERLVDRYVAFILKARSIYPRIALWGPGATQPEGAPPNLDFPANGSEKERNDATRMFTELLAARARAIGVPMLSLLPMLIAENGLTRPELLFDGCHISQQAMAEAQQLAARTLGVSFEAR